MNKALWTVEHIGMPVSDPGKLQDWYVRVLDGEIVWQDDSGSVFFVRLNGGIILEIGPAKGVVKETGDNTIAGFRHLALQVESIEAARDVLQDRGVVFTEDPKAAGGGGRVLFFADPEGNLLHLVERPENSVFAL